jgi:hypothetical protein
MRRALFGLLLGTALLAPLARAQQPAIDLKVDSLFYGDNTEFFNRYRTGETILGIWGRAFFSARLSDLVEVRAGVFADERFGSGSSFNLVRPVLALRIGTDRSRFIFGTLETVRPVEGGGPDRLTLHGLLPPLQVETLALTRPEETGVQWLVATERVASDLWFNYQKLNTKEHREVLDAGLAARGNIAGPLALAFQAHVSHHGGQLYDVGPVSDSWGFVFGPSFTPKIALFDTSEAEVYGLYTQLKPDRSRPELTENGHALFVRLSATRAGFRLHLIIWRARDFATEDGDPNYMSLGENGVFHPGSRKYAELGLTKVFRPVPGVVLDASARLHQVESKTEYSYRLVAKVDFDVPILSKK